MVLGAKLRLYQTTGNALAGLGTCSVDVIKGTCFHYRTLEIGDYSWTSSMDDAGQGAALGA